MEMSKEIQLPVDSQEEIRKFEDDLYERAITKKIYR